MNSKDHKAEQKHLTNSRILLKIVIAIILLFIGFVTPLIVHIEADRIVSQITADGMLEYIVGFLSFGATLALTLYALNQTKQSNDMAKNANDITTQAIDMAQKANEITEKANKIAEHAYDIEKYNYQLQIRPFVTVTDYEIAVFSQKDIIFSDGIVFYEAGKWDSISNINGIKFRITNTTDSFLTFSFDDAILEHGENEWRNSCVGEKSIKNRIISLTAGESKEIAFIADEKMLESLWGNRITMSFILENSFMQKYKEKFDIIFLWISKEKEFSWKCVLNFQNFHIYRFEYNEDSIVEVEEEI